MSTVSFFSRMGLTASFVVIRFMVFCQAPALDSFFHLRFPGQINGGLLVGAAGKVQYENAFGMADFSRAQPNTAQTPFNLASVSKVITSTAVLQLVEKGRLRLQDPVKRYLPLFPYPSITIRHLLTHTSGLPDLELYEDLVGRYPDTIVTNKDIVPALQMWSKPLPFQPGEKWRYCNTNYDLLAVLIEKLSHLTYAQYIRRYIFEPAGMKYSFIATPEAKGVTAWVLPSWYSDRFTPADSVGRFHYINYNLSGLVGSTNIVTTLEDLFRFDAAVFSYRLLSKASVDLSTSPVRLNDGSLFVEGSMDTFIGEGKGSYGMGWSLFDIPNLGKAVGHGGFNYGLYTFYFHRLDPAQTVIAFDNTARSSFARVVTSAVYLAAGQKDIGKTTKMSLARRYGITLKDSGADAATVLFHELRADTAHYYLDEREMNWLGYDFLRANFEGHINLALETFRLNTFLYPQSFNVFDSYGEALAKNGMKPLAIAMYRKSLLLKPDNQGALKALEMLQSKE